MGLLKNAHLFVALQTAPLNVFYIRLVIRFWCALHLSIRVTFRLFEQPLNKGFSTTPKSPVLRITGGVAA
jgi:hypothetical protein